MAGTAVPDWKKDKLLCGGCFCYNAYCFAPEGCCTQDNECLCCTGDCTCCDTMPTQFGFCTCCPGCVVLPAAGCCVTPRALAQKSGNQELLAALPGLGKKADQLICGGCCLSGACADTTYCHAPETCCHGNSKCFCEGGDVACPCAPDVPSTCGCLGLTLYPKVSCCKKLGDLDYLTFVATQPKFPPQHQQQQQYQQQQQQ